MAIYSKKYPQAGPLGVPSIHPYLALEKVRQLMNEGRIDEAHRALDYPQQALVNAGDILRRLKPWIKCKYCEEELWFGSTLTSPYWGYVDGDGELHDCLDPFAIAKEMDHER